MREHIIKEIKRLAAQIGGKAPGSRMFEKETGITRGKWRGKLWAKWADALAEAGFDPNPASSRLDPNAVLDCLAGVCRQYKRPPSWAEWQMFAANNPDSVGVGSLRSAFGGLGEAIAELRDRAAENNEYDLLSILPETKASPPPPAGVGALMVSEGWVYLLQSGNHFKIGRSDELEKRVKQISISLPEKVELVHAIQTDDPPGIEAYWHRRFADQRANGEWFKLSALDVKAFKRRKFQ